MDSSINTTNPTNHNPNSNPNLKKGDHVMDMTTNSNTINQNNQNASKGDQIMDNTVDTMKQNTIVIQNNNIQPLNKGTNMDNISYENYTKEELIQEIYKLKRTKKYGLVWEDTKENLASICKHEFPILHKINEKCVVNNKTEKPNILIEGDNFHALSVLNYTHEKKIDVIYIDPPYNTGNNDFVYNDKYVDREDGYRHSKWLSFMQKRLKIARRLLSERGIIMISIDENEFAQLKLLCDDVFGENNYLGSLIWEKKLSGANDSKYFAINHEYILVYAKNPKKVKRFYGDTFDESHYPYEDEKGRYLLHSLDITSAIRYTQSLDYPITAPDGTLIYPNKNNEKSKTWMYSLETLQQKLEENMIVFKKNKKGEWRVYYKIYQKDNSGKERRKIMSSIIDQWGTTHGTNLIKQMFNNQSVFPYAKPLELMCYLLRATTYPDSIVLDFFAGSGTTGHAVLQLNKEDGGNRRFILVTNNENNICNDITYPRIIKAINGYDTPTGKHIDGLGGNLNYYKISLSHVDSSDCSLIHDRKEMSKQLVEICCLCEDCYELVYTHEFFKMFVDPSGEKYLVVLFSLRGIPDLADIYNNKLNGKQCVVYTYSWFGYSLDRDIQEYIHDTSNIITKIYPSVITNVYYRIFKEL